MGLETVMGPAAASYGHARQSHAASTSHWTFLIPKTIVSICAFLLLLSRLAVAEPLKVTHPQGEVRAYLALRSDDGTPLGIADVVNTPVGKAWRSRITIHFRDGSIDDDTTTFTQSSVFHLLMDHHVQKGPSFPKPSDVTIDMRKGDVTYHEAKDGKDETKTEHMDLPADLANGIMPMLLQNLPKGATEVKVGYLVTTPKPRLVSVEINPDGVVPYRIGGLARSAAKYRIHIDIGGIAGVIAPLIGKQPPDLAAWVSTGVAPTFLKLYGFLYLGGPTWRLELTSPQW